MLGQVGAGERLANTVVADIGDFNQAVEQAESLKNAGVYADADVRVPGFDFLESRAGREGALGHDCHRQPSTPAGIMDVGA